MTEKQWDKRWAVFFKATDALREAYNQNGNTFTVRWDIATPKKKVKDDITKNEILLDLPRMLK